MINLLVAGYRFLLSVWETIGVVLEAWLDVSVWAVFSNEHLLVEILEETE